MPGPTLTTEAFVLAKHPPADAFQAFTAFSSEHGLLELRQRVSRRASPALPPLDLFDAAAFVLDSGQARIWFVREARVLRRHEGIGRDYEALRHACALATLVTRNARHLESTVSLHALLAGALPAFASADRPDIVYLKSLYRFARDEGHPVREDWFPTLSASDQSALAELLRRPLAAQSAPAPLVEHFRQRLETYLRGHTELIFD